MIASRYPKCIDSHPFRRNDAEAGSSDNGWIDLVWLMRRTVGALAHSITPPKWRHSHPPKQGENSATAATCRFPLLVLKSRYSSRRLLFQMLPAAATSPLHWSVYVSMLVCVCIPTYKHHIAVNWIISRKNALVSRVGGSNNIHPVGLKCLSYDKEHIILHDTNSTNTKFAEQAVVTRHISVFVYSETGLSEQTFVYLEVLNSVHRSRFPMFVSYGRRIVHTWDNELLFVNNLCHLSVCNRQMALPYAVAQDFVHD